MSTAENQIEARPLHRKRSLKEQWAERAKARKMVQPVDMTDFPDEPPLWIRKLTGSEANDWYEKWADADPEDRAAGRQRNNELVAMTLCDEDGTPVFEPDDLPALPNDLYQHVLSVASANIGMRRKKREDGEGN